MKSQAGASSVSAFRGSLRRETPSLMLVIRAGHPKRVTVVTLGLLRPEFGGSIKREPRARVNCEEVSGPLWGLRIML
eukprot:5588773-Pyramimonas_sp.AAC.1